MTQATDMARKKRQRIGLYLEPDLYELIVGLAERETRSSSNMAERLIVEALIARGDLEDDEE